MTQNPYDKAMEQTILEPYFFFYEKMKDKFKDEQAMQSAIATCMIRYANLCDKNPNFNTLLKKLSESADKAKTPIDDVLISYYEPLIRTLPRNVSENVKNYIAEKSKNFSDGFEKFDENLREYLYRNGWTFDYVCTLSPAKKEE